ncbi:hypothetical protein Cabys_1245 [Caldithrix abyssi DSM 13497]|uniref:Uncharacterized protein n=1 Tax=Caldithrix abyssi DSM 13497 TaxID=880073 RepID=A0A1J1C7L5_CALAY|nr:hypothetical protein Cabys_1245 [Caldithrix abyssi DSM 13497]
MSDIEFLICFGEYHFLTCRIDRESDKFMGENFSDPVQAKKSVGKYPAWKGKKSKRH